jgi:ribosomal protein S2
VSEKPISAIWEIMNADELYFACRAFSDNDEDPSILDLLIPGEAKSHPSGTASLDMLQREYNKRREHQPAEDWVCHAENLWAEKYPPKTLVEKGYSSNAFEMNDLMWRLLVRRYAVRAQLIDIM